MKDENLVLVGTCYGSVDNIKKNKKDKNISKKYLWKLPKTKIPQGIESGYFYGVDYYDRHCLTISTQQGCFLSKLEKPCKFCITGQKKYLGQLSTKQILQQILFLIYDNKIMKNKKPIEVAYMGMGEPGFNYEEVAKSIEYSEKIFKKLNLESKRYIFATIGIPDSIIKLGKDISNGRFGEGKIRLHLSLHAHTDEMRNEIVPANKIYPIKDIIKSAKRYIREIEKIPSSDKKISVNYMMFNNFETDNGKKYTTINKESMDALAGLFNDTKHFRPILCEFNESWTKNKPVSYKKALELKKYLEEKGYDAKIFGSFGHNINLACGQLSGDLNQKNLCKATKEQKKITLEINKIIAKELK